MKTKTPTPAVTSGAQVLKPSQATALLADWGKDTSRSAKAKHRIQLRRWMAKHGLTSLTVTDVVECARHYQIEIPFGVDHGANVRMKKGISANAEVGETFARGSVEELLSENERLREENKHLWQENKELKDRLERNKKSGRRGSF